MTMCITGKSHCRCQPDEGDFCYNPDVARLQSEVERLRGRCGVLEDQKHKLKWRLAYQAMHHVRLHNRWVCGELKAPEEEAIVNPFMYAETEVWWAIGDEADGFEKELLKDDDAQRLRQQAAESEHG